MDDVAILSYTKMNNANIVNDSHSMPISGGVGVNQEQSSAALLSLPVLLVVWMRSTHTYLRSTFAHIAKLDEVLDEYALFIIAQTLLATTLYTELFQ